MLIATVCRLRYRLILRADVVNFGAVLYLENFVQTVKGKPLPKLLKFLVKRLNPLFFDFRRIASGRPFNEEKRNRRSS